MMKIKHIVLLCLLFLAVGCRQNATEDFDVSKIYLGIDGVAQITDDSKAETRAAVDQWDNTEVSIAYCFGTPRLFNKTLTLNIANDTGTKHVNTGLEYPLDGGSASLVGYHPVVASSALGIVDFDISEGKTDIMLSNQISGTVSIPIAQTMKFEHKLTRFTFMMKCKSGETYPETIHGVRASATDPATKRLMTQMSLNLNNGIHNFSFPGQVTNRVMQGVIVPENSAPDNTLVFDMMLQPNVPVKFEVITLSDVKSVTIGANTLWNAITTTTGGEEGKQYIIKLLFSGESIIGDGISITPWIDVGSVHDGGTWW